MADLVIPLLIVFLFYLWFWCREFVQLMLLADADFPGKYDKPLWVSAFIFVFLLAPFAFVFWKQSYLELRTIEKNRRDPKDAAPNLSPQIPDP